MNHFFKKIILSSLTFFVLMGFANLALAQDGLLFNQSHYYSVVFRGNGEAIVYAKIALTNPDEQLMTDFSFEVPKTSPTEMVIYQMKLSPKCISYDNNSPQRSCLEYQNPDYTNQYYRGNSRAEYQKVEYTKSGNVYQLRLPEPVEAGKSTAIIIAYAAKGYVNDFFGLYKFNFKTLKVSSRIQQIRVAVDVDSDLLIKGRKASVNYNDITLKDQAMSPSSVSDSNLDNIVGQIGSSYNPLIKEAKNLAPGESFTVKGEYAASWFRLYLNSIIFTVLIIAVILAIIYLLIRFFVNKSRFHEQTMNVKKISNTKSNPPNQINMLILINASVSLISVILVVIVTYLIRIFLKSRIFYSINLDPGFVIIIFIAIFLLYLLLIIAPAVAVAAKYGWRNFIYILIGEFLWFVLFAIIYLILFQSGLTGNIYRVGEMPYQI